MCSHTVAASHEALKANPGQVQGHNHALQELSGPVKGVYSEGCHHPPCLPAYNDPAFISQTYRSSGWVVHFLTLSRLR